MVKAAKVGTIVKVDGTTILVVPNKGTRFTLKEVQEIVGGYVERVRLPHKAVMLVDEEGKLKSKPVNQAASEVAGQTIVGDVLLLPHGMGW